MTYNDTFYIYILFDPRNSLLRYVGKTNSTPSKRVSQHLQEAVYLKGTRYENKRTRWFEELRNLKLRPEIMLFDVVKGAMQSRIVERDIIRALYDCGHPLLNEVFLEHVKRTPL